MAGNWAWGMGGVLSRPPEDRKPPCLTTFGRPRDTSFQHKRRPLVIVCPKCSKENQDHYKFCLGCGAELPRETTPRAFSSSTPPHGVKASGGRVPAAAGSAPSLQQTAPP